MKFINKLKKISCLEIIFVTLFIVLIAVFLLKQNREGFVEEKKEFIKKTGNDIFDEFYVDIYDNLVHDENKNKFEIDRIFKTTGSNPTVLDVGSGTGHHVNLINNIENSTVIGIDNAPSMIKVAKQNYPDLDFRLANVLDTMQFPPNSFTHITCLYFTIYYIKNKRQFFDNCYKWLQPNGVLVIHLVNMHKFDPIISVANPFILVSPQSYTDKRITESKVKFDSLDYKADFQLDETISTDTATLNKPNAIFKETFKFDNKKSRINEHNLYMSSQKSILAMARDVGFILQSQEEMDGIQYENNYLYTLVKPG
jgi:ubiquinone/menaquinone biosynthesis C-methylase UbiE